MDPKRKRIYIILIVCCLVLSAGILLWDKFSGSSATSAPVTGSSNNQAASSNSTTPDAAIKKDSNGIYPAPVVFPNNKTLDTGVLDFSAFKVFSPYQPAQVSPGELGRDDPFKKY